MKFLVDGSSVRLAERLAIWPEGILGQLLTPLTNYRLCAETFAVDNGAFTKFNEAGYKRLLARYRHLAARCLFVAAPDKLGSHRRTLRLWWQYNELLHGWPAAFVAQDGYEGMPAGARALFIGGTTEFKESALAAAAVADALAAGKHVHIGRVNTPKRYLKFKALGAHTCDGSGFSRYDHMVVAIREACHAL